jgi:hypothetical protein
MIAILFYLVVCLAVSMVMTFLYVMTRPIRNRDELRSWRVGIGLTIFVFAVPYIAIEAQTRLFGTKMKEAVTDAMDDAGIEGDLLYYKVIFYQGSKARVLAIGEEKQSWGGTDHPAVKMTLTKNDKGWSAESYHIVYSDNRNLDGVVFPPYW